MVEGWGFNWGGLWPQWRKVGASIGVGWGCLQGSSVACKDLWAACKDLWVACKNPQGFLQATQKSLQATQKSLQTSQISLQATCTTIGNVGPDPGRPLLGGSKNLIFEHPPKLHVPLLHSVLRSVMSDRILGGPFLGVRKT